MKDPGLVSLFYKLHKNYSFFKKKCVYPAIIATKIVNSTYNEKGKYNGGFIISLLLQAFTASSILRTHIRQHSGERPFKCKHCGKAFASHAAHDSHVRRTHARDKPHPCDLCGASFQEEQELHYHMKNHKSKKYLRINK